MRLFRKFFGLGVGIFRNFGAEFSRLFSDNVDRIFGTVFG